MNELSVRVETAGSELASPYGASSIIGGKYFLTSVLGVGGMGTVWVARHRELGSEVALKLIRRDFAKSPAALDRLLREARTAAGFHHPNIVRVFDFGRTACGDPYIVMERLDGMTLAAFLRARGRLSAVQAVRVLLPVLSAIVAAHLKGVIHRDIKPENVFLSEQDGGLTPKLLDFGIARLLTEGTRRITADGAILGSPDYLSPEQAQGSADVDERSDTWAACVTLYELITGELPFNGRNYNGVMRSIVQDSPRPTTDFAAGDARLWEIIRRGLQKEPDDRFQSALQLARELASWALESGVEVDVSGKSISSVWLESAWRGSGNRGRGTPPEGSSLSLPPSSPQRGPHPLAVTLRTEDQASNAITLIRAARAGRPRTGIAPRLESLAALGLGLLLALGGATLLRAIRERSAITTASPEVSEVLSPPVPGSGRPEPLAGAASGRSSGARVTGCARCEDEPARAP
jgi:serine/threonine-protein kinase